MQSQAMTEYGAPLVARNSATPEPKGREVVVKIRNCGVCHSDLHMHDGFFDVGGGKHMDVRQLRELPFILGHEIQGSVFARGPDAGDVNIGDEVAVYPWIGCGTCKVCTQGEEIYCANPRHLGIYVDGGFASHVLVPDARYLLDISGIDPSFAALCMCSGLTAFSTLNKLMEQARHGPVMIVGLGGVGMMGVEIARALFAEPPLVADIDAGKRAEALERGAAAAYDPSDPGARKAVLKETGGVTGAADFVGLESSFSFASGVLAKGGKLVVAGMMGGSFSMAIPVLPMRGITITGNFVGSLEEARNLLDLARTGAVKPIPMETRPLSDANKALDDLRGGKVTGRIVLQP